MTLQKKLICASLVFFLFIITAPAQVYTFKNYTQDNGLPQSYIYDICQGKDGFLFVSTGEGLGAFGGAKFRKYNKKDKLAENFVYSIYLDSKGLLWLGHFQSGVSCMKKEELSKIRSGEFTVSKVTSFTEDDKGNIYFASGPGGIYKIIGDSASPFLIDQLPNINKLSFMKGKIWVATQSGLYTVNPTEAAPKPQLIAATKDDNISCFDADDANNGIWVGSENRGLSFFEYTADGLSQVYSIKEELNKGSYPIRDLKKIQQTLWVSVYGDGIRLVDLKKNSFLPEKIKKVNNSNGLESPFITKIFEDREGNVWLGSFGEGLFQFISARFEFFTKNNGLPFDNVIAITSNAPHSLVLLGKKEICLFNTLSNEYNNLSGISGINEDNSLRCCYYDNEFNRLLVGSEKAGILILEINKGIKLLKTLDAFKQSRVNAFFKKDKNYYISTDDGLYITDMLFNILSFLNTNNGLPHNSLSGCFVDKSDRLWLFSPETPLYYIENDSVTLLKDIPGLSSFKFISAFQDNKNSIWFCTEGDGIFKYNGKIFTQYSTQSGLLSDFGYFIAGDKQNIIVVGHKNGVSIKHHNKKDFTGVDKAKGLILLEYNQNSVFVDPESNFWLGSSKGLIKYNSSLDKTNTLPPALNMQSLTINNVSKNINDTVFNYSYDDYNIQVSFIGISLTDPEGVSYRYKLEGIDKEWRYTKEKTIEYPLINDGDFTFILYSSNSDGFENPKPLKFQLKIDKPLWKKTWFYLLLIFVIIEIFHLIYIFRTRALRRQNLILEKKVIAKTQELQKEKEHVEAANKLLEEKNNDILDSINYAERIQTALLPKKEIIELYINSFIYYKPRDIVSGDFYWYHIKNDFIYVAVIDCTGHGVPGAFMSIIGSTLLDQVLTELQNPLPGEVLGSLNAKVNRSLKQFDSGSESHDGMDIVMCRLNPLTREIYFAGARRPLYLIRQGEFNEYKGAIEPVGGHVFSTTKTFENHRLTYESGDMIYLFSDGYADQFGGTNNTKYLSKNFKTFLLSIYDKTLEEQKYSIDQEFRRWKGTMPQIDDILIWGIRL